jgi:hypothetical protein
MSGVIEAQDNRVRGSGYRVWKRQLKGKGRKVKSYLFFVFRFCLYEEQVTKNELPLAFNLFPLTFLPFNALDEPLEPPLTLPPAQVKTAPVCRKQELIFLL